MSADDRDHSDDRGEDREKGLVDFVDRFSRALDSIEWIGASQTVRRHERAELERLIERYPDLARELLAAVQRRSPEDGQAGEGV